MFKQFYLCLSVAFVVQPVFGQDREPKTIEIRGDRVPVEAAQLTTIWLFPEDYVGTRIRLHGFLLEAENVEFFPELNGYLFSCEPTIYGRAKAIHPHVGNASFLSQEKLNFFCSRADGQRLRQLFKKNSTESAIMVDMVLEVKQKDGKYFGTVTLLQPQSVKE